MNRWAQLSTNELNVLEAIFWQHGPSHDVLAQHNRPNNIIVGIQAPPSRGRILSRTKGKGERRLMFLQDCGA